MQFVMQYLEKFAELFSGNKEHYGVHIPEKNPKEGEKAKGKSWTEHSEVTQDLYLQHLHGKQSIGIIPVNSSGNIRFAAIDVDVYPLNPTLYLNLLKRAGLPLVGFRSKSGGLHLYLFFSEDTAANKVLPYLNTIRQLLALPKDTEIFPKQSRVVGTSTGNFINIPYFNVSKTARYAYDYEGNKLDLEAGINLCYNSRVTLTNLIEILSELPLAQAPPCLQTIYLSGAELENERNIFLFNCAVYLKARFGEDFQESLYLLNEHITNPLNVEELDKTVVQSHRKRDYTYQCKNGILSGYCDKEICGNRKYGITSDNISNLSYEKLTQVKSAEPYYIWTVNGVEMHFYNETELMNQNKFRELCLRQLHLVPKRLTDNAWIAILNRALDGIVIEEVDEVDDISVDSLWIGKVTEFLSRQIAINPKQIEDGLIWYDAKKKYLHFKGALLLEFLEQSSMFKSMSSTKHRELLKKLGAKQDRLNAGNGAIVRSWSLNLPAAQKSGYLLTIAVDKFSEEDLSFAPIDFEEDSEF